MAAKYNNLNTNELTNEVELSAPGLVETEPAEQTSNNVENRSRWSKSTKRILLVSLVALLFTGTIIAVVLSTQGNSTDENPTNTGSSAALQGHDHDTGQGDSSKHLVDLESQPDKVCKGLVYHTNGEARNKGGNRAQYANSIKNSSCFLCNDSCLDVTYDRNVICGDNALLFFVNCELRKEMKNFNVQRCGGNGEYKCYRSDTNPKCRCDNGKKGDKCDVNSYALCKCWWTKSELRTPNNIASCDERRDTEPGQCIKRLNEQMKCLCDDTQKSSEDYPDCSTIVTADKQAAKSCGPIVQSSVLLIVFIISFWHMS